MKFVKCITGVLGLQPNFVYEVEQEQEILDNNGHVVTHYLLKGSIRLFPKSWFQEIIGVVGSSAWGWTTFSGDLCGNVPISSLRPVGKKLPDEEERLRNLLKPRVDPGQCACGISKQVCTYHKD